MIDNDMYIYIYIYMINSTKNTISSQFTTVMWGTVGLSWSENYSTEPTALGRQKVRCYAEVPEQDELLSPLSVYGYRMAVVNF